MSFVYVAILCFRKITKLVGTNIFILPKTIYRKKYGTDLESKAEKKKKKHGAHCVTPETGIKGFI